MFVKIISIFPNFCVQTELMRQCQAQIEDLYQKNAIDV